MAGDAQKNINENNKVQASDPDELNAGLLMLVVNAFFDNNLTTLAQHIAAFSSLSGTSMDFAYRVIKASGRLHPEGVTRLAKALKIKEEDR